MYVDLILLVTDVPESDLDPNDVVAGWTAFALFGILILAVVVLGFSLTKRLKNVEAAEAAGLYDPSTKKKRTVVPGAFDSDEPTDDDAPR